MIKRYFRYFKPYKKLFILDMFCAVIFSSSDLVMPLITKNYINEYIPNTNVNMMIKASIFVFMIIVLRAIAKFIMGYYGHLLGTYIEHDLRRDVFKSIQKHSFSFFDKRKTGDIMATLTADIRNIAEFSHHGPEDFIVSGILILGSFIILATFNLYLTLLLLIFVFVIIVVAVSYRYRLSNSFTDMRKAHAEINSAIQSSISGARLTKSFANEEYEKKKFSIYNKDLKNSWRKVYFVLGSFLTINTFLLDLLSLFVISIGGIFFVAKGYIDTGEFVAFMLYLSYLIQPIKRVVDLSQMYMSSMTGLSRAFDMIDTRIDIENKGNLMMHECIGDIKFENVSFTFNDEDEKVLDNVSFNISSGSLLAIIGESGAGKTTISSLLPRFYEIEHGVIKIDNIDIKKYDLYSLRENIGIVQQDIFVFYGTILENISYGKPNASNEEIIAAAKNAELHDFIMSLPNGYDTILGERGVTLSGGQRQRLGIARVFLKDPSILILDEATSALDTITEKRIQSAFERLAVGRTTIIIAHRLSTIKNVEQIIIMDKGVIVDSGTHSYLRENSKEYNKLYGE